MIFRLPGEIPVFISSCCHGGFLCDDTKKIENITQLIILSVQRENGKHFPIKRINAKLRD